MQMKITNSGMSIPMPVRSKEQRLNIFENVCMFLREGVYDANGYRLDLINSKLSSGAEGFRFAWFETEWFEFNAYKDNPVRNRFWLIGKDIKIEFKRLSGFESGVNIKIAAFSADKSEIVILENKGVEYTPGFKLPTSDAIIEGTIKGEHTIL